MIEPPISEIIDLLESCGFVAKAAYLRDAAKEMEALQAIVKELAASNCMTMNEEDTEYCIFCGRFKWSGHEADCLVARAKELVK